MKFIQRIQRFMYGRYGIDELTKLLLKVYFVILIVNLFINSYIILIIELLILTIVLFRTLSKNLYNRNIENKKYLDFKNKVSKRFKDKDHVYKRCHKCHVVMKLPVPKKRGIKHSTCPKCKKRNAFLILRKQKKEVISNKNR